MEPYKIKSIEMLPRNTREERLELLKDAGYNLFMITAKHVIIDLLTDSGTGAMSTNQWSVMMIGDESYAGSASFEHFQCVARQITNFTYITPVHQGRAGERIMCQVICPKNTVALSNTMFDTTRAHVENTGTIGIDFPVAVSKDTAFNGDMDVHKLEEYIANNDTEISLLIMTVTNNMGGGHPVSMDNIRKVARLCRQNKITLFMDGCRYAENTWFIKTHEAGYQDKSPMDIAQEMFSYFDGCLVSTKKDGICNNGGFLATNDPTLYAKFSQEVILSEGFITYGGLAGRDLEAMAVGLLEALDENYLRHRIESTAKFGEILKQFGVPVLEPFGGHAVYVDAGKLCPHIDFKQYPGWALCCALYLEGGIRACALGNVMNGVMPDGTERLWPKELVRLAIPRRTYTMSHFMYVGQVFRRIAANCRHISPMKIVKASNVLRHFTASLVPIKEHLFEPEGNG